jgi:hypothetical protein
MDHPARQPKQFALQRGKHRQIVSGGLFGHQAPAFGNFTR